MKKLHQQIWAKVKKEHEMYKGRANKHCKAITFKHRDLVQIHLRKETFPSKRKNKLMPRSDGPFKVLKKVNDNAHKLELLEDMSVSSIFNVGYLLPFLEDEEDGDDLRENHSQEGEDEANVMPTQVQVNLQILFSAHKPQQRGHGPCTESELQF